MNYQDMLAIFQNAGYMGLYGGLDVEKPFSFFAIVDSEYIRGVVVWITVQKSKSTISEHISNIYKEGELKREDTRRNPEIPKFLQNLQ